MERCCSSAEEITEVEELPKLEFGNSKTINGAESAIFRRFETKLKKNLILVFQPARSGSAIYVSRSVYYFEWYNSAIHRLDLDENEELEAVQEIGSQPGRYYYPVLFEADSDYCT